MKKAMKPEEKSQHERLISQVWSHYSILIFAKSLQKHAVFR